MIFKRLHNLWKLSGYEPVSRGEPIKAGELEMIPVIRPTKKAQIIKKENVIEKFINS